MLTIYHTSLCHHVHVRNPVMLINLLGKTEAIQKVDSEISSEADHFW